MIIVRQRHFLKLVSLLCLLAFSGCNQEEPPEIQFNSFQEELDHLVESYVRMGAAVGVIDKSQNTHEFYLGNVSNTGMGPVGHVLGLINGSSNEEVLFDDQIPYLAPGHDEGLDSVKNYHATDIFQGAGFLKSSLHDMMIYLQAQMGLLETPLDEAIELTHQPYFEVGGVTYGNREGYYNLSIALAWHIDVLPEGYTFYWHGGRTNGYMAYMAFDLETISGTVILCNQSCAGVNTRFGEEVLQDVNTYPVVNLFTVI